MRYLQVNLQYQNLMSLPGELCQEPSSLACMLACRCSMHTQTSPEHSPTDIDIYNSCSRYSEKVKVKVNRNLRHRRSDYCVLIVIP